ncbi:MAG: TIGR03564 family F420-dependent LLM class oxidoreductase [Acidimicrobiales bacterium]|nr:TIGR03564 family F420-dependent LLM class oxidoreductase [Acidimicrobiales bacterium]
MRIGINGSSLMALGRPTSELVAHAAAAEADGFATYWVAQLAVPDALTVLAVVGQATASIELGTAVIATWPRHPLMLAAQALTTSELCGGRLVLGIGLAHKSSIEQSLRIPFSRPARHMDEYLSVLLPVLAHRRVSFEGEIWSGEADNVGGPPDVAAPSVMLAAMGPRMLALAGSRTDGTVLWLSGPRTIESEIAPALAAAAERAGRAHPRIVASVPVCVTDRPELAKGLIGEVLVGYNDLPSYRRVMDIEGVAGPADVSLVGDEDTVRAGLARFAAAGTTDFSALEFVTDDEEAARTRALLRAVHATS